jgi:ribose transport system permease protein
VNGFFVVCVNMPSFVVTLGMLSITRWLAVMIVMALWLGHIFNFKAWGRYLPASGGNENAARLSGVPVDWTKFQAYAFPAFTAAASPLLLGCNGLRPGAIT